MNATVDYDFVDPITNDWCTLVVPPEGRVYPDDGEAKIGIRHPGCDEIADLAIELDAFHCQSCGIGGRVSGAWAVDMIETPMSARGADTPATKEDANE